MYLNKEKYFPDNLIITCVRDNILQTIDFYVKSYNENFAFEYELELRDCIMWCLNLYNEMISSYNSIIISNNNSNNQFDKEIKNYEFIVNIKYI